MIRLASAGFVKRKLMLIMLEGTFFIGKYSYAFGKKEELKSFVCHLMNRKCDMIDTHSHLFAEEFTEDCGGDRTCQAAGVSKSSHA